MAPRLGSGSRWWYARYEPWAVPNDRDTLLPVLSGALLPSCCWSRHAGHRPGVGIELVFYLTPYAIG